MAVILCRLCSNDTVYSTYFILLLILLECLMQIQVALIYTASLICSWIHPFLLLDQPGPHYSSLMETFFFSRKCSILMQARSSRTTQQGIVILIMQRTAYSHTCLIGSYTHVEQVLITLYVYHFFIRAELHQHHPPCGIEK